MIRVAIRYSSLILSTWVLHAQVNVLTGGYDNNRTNANLSEYVLNKSNVNPTQFGKLYSFPVDGDVYAQPLYVQGLHVGGVTRNVLYVATMNNTVYAFDADASGGTAPLWSRNLGNAVNPHAFDIPPSVNPLGGGGEAYTDILDQIGILSTPVIDLDSNAIYVVHFTIDKTTKVYSHNVHALDLATGAEKFGGPVMIQGNVTGTGWGGIDTPVNGQIPFISNQHIQRPALLLANGTVYVAFGSHGDAPPWHGWIMGYDAATLQQTALFNTTSNDAGGASVWQGGRGMAADGNGNIFCATGNGTFDGKAAWGESVLRLSTNGGLNVADFFTPEEWSILNGADTDVGSTGPILIPGTNLLFEIGKEGVLFVLNRENLGGVGTTNNNQVVQNFQAADPTLTIAQQQTDFLVFNDAFWDNIGGQILYIWPHSAPLRSYRMTNGVFNTTNFASNTTVTNANPFPGMTVSAYGSLSSSGILWATSAKSKPLPAGGTLHAFDALNLTELWNSDMSGDRDTLGDFTKFANPTIANGKVFTPCRSREVVVYGLLPNVPGVAAVVNSASFSYGSIAPGELVTIFGNVLGPTGATQAGAISGRLPSSLGGIEVKFNGKIAPLLYTSAGQINAVVPFDVAGQTSVEMDVVQSNGTAISSTLQVADANPSIFAANSSGSGQGAILNHDLSPNSASNPAARGTGVAIYVNGAGVTKPGGTDGLLAPSVNPPLIAQTVKVTIGGVDAKVTYQGAAPGLVEGMSQVNVTVPAGVTPGPAVPVTLTVGNTKSVNTVTMAVQ